MAATTVARATNNDVSKLPEILHPDALVARLARIEDAVATSMKVNIDYGTIPGTPKPTLYKSGAEKLCTLFSIAPDYIAEEILAADGVTIRVKCVGIHQQSNAPLGSGMGEASSNEAKWKWRKPVCQEEFDETPADRRRRKWCRGKTNAYQELQIRTEPDDLRNTVLKMACKRAQIAMVLNVTNASAIFLQDLEDMPDEIREQLIEAERERRGDRGQPAQRTQAAPPRQSPAAKASAPGVATQAQVTHIRRKLDEAGMSAEQLCTQFKVAALAEIPFDVVNAALDYIKDPERAAIQAQAEGGAQ